MKKITAIFLCIFLLMMSACSVKNGDDKTTTEEKTTGEITTEPVIEPMTEKSTEPNKPVFENTDGRVFYGKNTGTDKTYTGLESLPLFNFAYRDVGSFSSCSRNLISHSFGVAKNEQPHEISVTAQKYFDDNSFDAVCLDVKSTEKTLYLTFDCGYENGYTAKILDTLKEKGVPAAFFCTLPQMKDNPEIIARMINEGHIVGNHSVTHPNFSTLSAERILEEVKGFDDYIRENFGYSSFYFRYPEGKYSDYCLRALNDLGFKCVFWSLAYADWDLNAQKGAAYAVDTVISRIHPGSVMLLHAVSPDNAAALGDIIDKARDMGYTFKSLEDM